MLIHDDRCLQTDPISAMIAEMNNNSSKSKQLMVGVYEIGSFGGTGFLEEFKHYPAFEQESNDDYFGSYGVCDNFQQILDKCPEIEKSKDRQFIITVTPVLKENQSPEGGWRWCKWGDYIGEHSPQYEYLYDEEDIDMVYCYHVYEKK